MWVDCHTHLNFEVFENDWREVVDRAVVAGVEKMIVVGTDLTSSRRAIDLASQHPALFAAVGIHPHHAKQVKSEKLKIKNLKDKLRELAKHPRVVAIGEVGLDYHVYRGSKYSAEELKITDELKGLQKELLQMQVEVAQELDKPLIIHSREAGEEVLNIVKNEKLKMKNLRGVFHCFGGSKKYLKRIVAAGFYVSFTGQITYVPDRAGVALGVPVERLLTETDCPYMPPYRGDRRSEPRDVIIIGQCHAQARQLAVAEIEAATTANAEELFGLKEQR